MWCPAHLDCKWAGYLSEHSIKQWCLAPLGCKCEGLSTCAWYKAVVLPPPLKAVQVYLPVLGIKL